MKCDRCDSEASYHNARKEKRCSVCFSVLSPYEQQHFLKIEPEPKPGPKPEPPGQEPGVKYDAKKRRFGLLPWKGVAQVVDVLEYGANKYPSADNWRKVSDGENRYKEALLRHVVAYVSGESHDPESGLPHLAHAVCCALFLLDGGLTK